MRRSGTRTAAALAGGEGTLHSSAHARLRIRSPPGHHRGLVGAGAGVGRRLQGDRTLAHAEATEVLAQRVGRRIAHRRILRQQLGDDRLERPRHVGDELVERCRVVVHLPVGDAHRIVAGEWGTPGDHLVHHDAERVQIAARVGLGALGLFRREVRRRAHHRPGLGQVRLRRCVEGSGDAEIGDLHRPVRADEDVGRLDVSVDEPGGVGETEGGGDFAGDLGGLLRVEVAVGPQDVGQRAPVDVLHGDEVRRGVLAPIEHVDDVRVVEVGRCLGFAAEALDEVRVDGELREQHLDRHLAIEQAVVADEDVGHPATPDALDQLVAIVDDRRSLSHWPGPD